MTATMPETIRKRHPFRGAIYGLVMGIGVSLALMVNALIAIGTLTPIVIPFVGLLAGVVWGLFAPPRKPQGPTPVPAASTPPPGPTPPPAAPAPPTDPGPPTQA